MTFSYHATYERADRLQALEEVLGFTKIVVEVPVVEEQKRYCLTSSGILIVKNLHREYVVTAFMATIDQTYRICRMAGKSQIPPKLEKRVVKNNERHRELFYIQGIEINPLSFSKKVLTNNKNYGII